MASLAAHLRETLSSTVLTPHSEGYLDSIARWSDTIVKHAAVVVYVESAEDISTTITACRTHNVPFAVAGGRHASSTASSIEDGLVIDMRKMRRVLVDPETKTLRVQGGCIWQDVDEAAAEHGLAMVGGTVNDTGVGGLTLGGGYGWLSGRHGLTIDSLLAVEVVLADGSIRRVSAEEEADLFWAVRGAGHCFCVAVEFVFQGHEQKNQVWAGPLGFPIDRIEGVVRFANDLVATSDGDSVCMMRVGRYPWAGDELCVLVMVFHNGGEDSGKSVFKPLLDQGPILNAVKERPYREVNGLMNHKTGRGFRRVCKGAAFTTPLRPQFLSEALIPEMHRLNRLVPGSERAGLLFEFFTPDKWCEVPDDATAFGHRGCHQNLMIAPIWQNSDDDSVAREWSLTIAKLVTEERESQRREAGLEPEKGPITEYGNYDHLSAHPRNIYGSNLERLVELKKRYDPENVFNKSYSLAL